MNEHDFDQLVTVLIESPARRDSLLASADLDDSERAQIIELLGIADLVWLAGQDAPPLEDDPAAALLGLVPDPECRLSRTDLTRIRKAAGVSPSQLAERLQLIGWTFNAGDVFRWETRSADDLPPAVIESIANALSVSVDQLIAASAPGASEPLALRLREHPAFDALAQRWARVQKVSTNVAVATLEARALATVHRGGEPDVEQMVRLLDKLINSIESTEER